MPVRFVIGRAGTGKTRHCLSAVRRRLRDDPIHGPRLIFLVPEQASYQMERALLDPTQGGAGCAHRADVLSFQRLAARVLESVGAPARSVLTEPARTMVLRRLTLQHADQLRYYQRAARPGTTGGPLGGFVDRLSATIAEFIEEAIEPDDLAELPAGDSMTGRDDAHRAKLHDLRLIYRAYLEFLGDDRLDPTQRLALARASFPRCPWLAGAELWVDGFASLSGQETLTLLDLARHSANVEMTMLLDPRLVDAASNGAAPGTAGFFARTLATYRDLERRLRERDMEVQDPLLLSPTSPPRYAPNPALARLERGLFTPGDGGGAEPANPIHDLEIVALPSPRVEVDYAVSRVCRWVQDPRHGFRYRDIALIVRDLEPYHDLLTQALSARNIPFFIDRRRPTAHHPLVELLRALLLAAVQDLSITSVRLLIKTGLLPITADAGDVLENYLLAHGISGASAWTAGPWGFRARRSIVDPPPDPTPAESRLLESVNATRATLVQLLAPWLAGARPTVRPTGTDWSQCLREWLDSAGVGDTLSDWSRRAENEGDLDQADEHRQVWRDVMSLLDDLAFALDGAPMTVAELAAVLDSGLAGLTLGLVPPTVDQVLVGSIERSRHPDIKAAVLLGFNDGVFPRAMSEDTILNDEDRRLLTDAGLSIRPPTRDMLVDERMLAYIALTRASHALVVTCAESTAAAQPSAPSPYLADILAAVPGLAAEHVGDPVGSRTMWSVLGHADVLPRLALEFRSRPPLEGDDRALRAAWNGLYASLRSALAADPTSRRAVVGLDEPSDRDISPDAMRRFHDGPLRTSVSRLETYAACPFQYFARYMLSLRERPEAALEAVDIGQVHHAILEDFVGSLTAAGRGFDSLSDEDLTRGLAAAWERVAARLPDDATIAEPRNRYLLRRAAQDLAGVVKAQRSLGKAGRFRPRFIELPFGFPDESGVPALALQTPGGRRVHLRGYIDRVDLVELADELLGIVVDYKRTRDKKLRLDMVYHGLSLQLVAYLLVLAESGETIAGRPIRPVAVLYQGLKPGYVRVDHPDRITPREAAFPGVERPDGLILADHLDALDASNVTGWSTYYSVYRKKDGTLGDLDKGDAADAAGFRAVLEHTRRKLAALADDILDGRMPVRPARLRSFNPCTWCAMGSVCRVETGLSDLRFLDALKRTEVFQRLTSPASGPCDDSSWPPS